MEKAGIAKHKQLFSNQMSLSALYYGTVRILNNNCNKEGLQQLNQCNTPVPKLFSNKRAGS